MRFIRRFLVILVAFCLAVLAGLLVPARMLATTAAVQPAPGTAASGSLSAAAPLYAHLYSTSPGVRFDRITTEDGLSQNTVTSILQDSQGFMWFGTEDGLNKYDGISFTVYRHDPDDPHSLRDDSIMALLEDSSGVLWVGTQAGWLERYDRENDDGQGARFVHYPFGAPVLSLYEDQQGVFWVATWDALYRFDRETEESIIAFTSIFATSMVEDREGVLWLGDLGGWLHFYDSTKEIFRPVPISVPVKSFRVTSVHEDGAGALWFGRDGGGLSRFDPEREDGQGARFVHYQHDPDDPDSLIDNAVSSVLQDRSGALWIGTQGGGLDRFDPESERFTHYQNNPGNPYSLSDNAVLSLYEDRSGVLWIGTLTKGLNRLDLVGGNIYHYQNIADDPNSLGDNVVLAIHEDREGVLWIGTRDGLDRFDRKRGVWRHYRHDADDPTSLSHNLVWSILEDSSGTLWIGTQAGLDRYDGENEDGHGARFVHYQPHKSWSPDAVQSLLEDRSGNLWVASSRGLHRFDRDTGRFDHVVALDLPLSWDFTRRGHSWRLTVFEDQMGALWLGTSGDGLFRLDGERLTLYQADDEDPQSLSSNFVFALFEDESGELWIGTGGGLDRFDRTTETFTHYRVKDGLPANEIRGILQDDIPPDQGGPYLWLSTVGGLSRFDPSTETFRNYDVTDGLQSNEFNAGATYKSSSGELFFGGSMGFNVFYPEQITDNPHVPPVVITEFGLFNQVIRKDLLPDEQIELSYQDNSLSFGFAALDYHAPAKNQYAYMMEGLDEDWVYARTRRFAEYRDLRPGDYVFRVKGSNNAGVWNEQGAAVHITITPPIWQTWWFRGLMGLALVAVALGAFRLRVRGVEARSRELAKQVEARTTELQQEIGQRVQLEEALRQSEREKAVVAERNRLARELHDSVAQSLYAMTLYAGAATQSLSSGHADTATDNLGKLRRTAKEALGETRLIIFELRPPLLEQEGLAGALRSRLDTVERRSGLKTEFLLEGNGRLPPDLEEGLYRTALEALNNVLKHANARCVTVSLCLDSRSAMLVIADDGVGFDPAAVPDNGGIGLRGMAERAEEIGAHLTVESRPEQGTRVMVVWSSDDGRQMNDQGRRG